MDAETTVKHPAKFSDAILAIVEDADLKGRLLDPFAGVGKVHQLDNRGIVRVSAKAPWRPQNRLHTYGVELEPEWAIQHHQTIVGDALDLSFSDDYFDHVVTSPCYGNRMADHHNARDDSHRNTYRHYLGRPLSHNSSAGMQWGSDYRIFHMKAWHEVDRVLKSGGTFWLNLKDHIRGGERQLVTEWHVHALLEFHYSFHLEEWFRIPLKGNRYGANRQRIPYESLLKFRRL